MRSAPPQPHRWTLERYHACIAAGIFRPDDHIQLIDGELIEMSPQNSPHASAIRAAAIVLEEIFAGGYDVRTQLPLALTDDSEPEPDVAVVSGHWRDYVHAHPTSALLVVEIADATLAFDRNRKCPLYASHGIPEYWIVNLVDKQVEVHREPSGRDFVNMQTFRAGEMIPASSVLPAPVRVDDVLPF